MIAKTYTTYLAQNLTVEQAMKFLADFSQLECTSFTLTAITWSETTPRLCSIALHVEQEQNSLLYSSFESGLLHHWSWHNFFTPLPTHTQYDGLNSYRFKQPKSSIV